MSLAAIAPPPAACLARVLAATLASATRSAAASITSGMLLMGRRDARTRRGKVFRSSNGTTRPKPAPTRGTGWWSGAASVADVPPVPPAPPAAGPNTPPVG